MTGITAHRTDEKLQDDNASLEKDSVTHVESSKNLESGVVDIDDGFDPAFVKRTVRKADFRLIPMLSAMYTISHIDRSNLSIARSANGKIMDRQLGLNVGSHYSIATLVFFIAYIVLEVPVSGRKVH